MPGTHRHSSRHRRDSGSRSEGHTRHTVRRSALNSERHAVSSEQAASARHGTGGHRHVVPVGRKSSVLCLLFAFLGLMLVIVAEFALPSNRNPAHPIPNLLAGACTLAAIGMGVHAQITQFRHWHRRVRNRILVGMPIALCTSLAILANLLEKHAPPAEDPLPAEAEAPAVTGGATREDSALIKPGWYGEVLSDGLLLVITSFEENADEARRFNRELAKPVAYATLSIINTGSAASAALSSLQVTLHLDSGETVQSLSLKELLSHGASHTAEIRKRLAERRELAAGAMIPDIPICMEAGFRWARVVAVTVPFGSRAVKVPGRMLTVEEKQKLLDNAAAPRRPGGTNTTAEAWFKNL